MHRSVRADTPETNAQPPASLRIGWGEPKDGLQIGLFPQNQQKEFRYGDTIALMMRARNVSKNLLSLTVKPPNISYVTLGEEGRLVLQTLGGGGNSVLLKLAPGETQDLPGGRYAAQIVVLGEKTETVDKATQVLALLPGVYHAECTVPLWMPDRDDVNRATAHRAKPGVFTFTVLKEGGRPPEIRKEVPDATIVWGETVNGLQGGLHRVTEKELAALPADQRKEIAADEILTRFYVRNTTDKPLRLAYHNFAEDDASFWVKDAQGQDHMVRSTYFTGFRAMREQTLPGEILPAGWGRLKFQTQETPPEQNAFTPLLTAKPGQYTLQLISSVRFSGLNRFDMTLVSAPLPFTVPPQVHP